MMLLLLLLPDAQYVSESAARHGPAEAGAE